MRGHRSTGGAPSRDPGALHEAALYGALAANGTALPHVLGACQGWEDTLWANLNAGLHTHVAALTDHYVKLATALPRPSAPTMPLTARTFHACLEHATSAGSSDIGASRTHHQLQRRLIELRLSQLPSTTMNKEPVAAQVAAGGASWGGALGGMLDDGVGVGIHCVCTAPAVGAGARPPLSEDALTTLLETMGQLSQGGERERAHLLRFAAHASLFILMPTQRYRDRDALPLSVLRELLSGYCRVLASAAALLAVPQASSETQIGAGQLSSGAHGRLSFENGVPTLEDMTLAVTLIASNLITEQGLDEDGNVTILSDFLAQLPPSLPTSRMASTLLQAHARHELRALIPRITLRTVLTLHATAATDAALMTDRMSGLWWLMLKELSDASDDLARGIGSRALVTSRAWTLAQLHHALALCLLLVRRAIAAGGTFADVLLPPAARASQAGFDMVCTKVLVRTGTCVLVEQRQDGLTMLVYTPDADGLAGAPTTFYAYSHLAGHRAVLPLSLPCRVRLTLIAEDDEIHFKSEGVQRLTDNDAAVSAALAVAQLAREMGSVVYCVDSPPNIGVIETLQSRCVEARHNLASALEEADGGSPPLPTAAVAQLDSLQTELRFWWLYLKASAEQCGWQAALAAKPLSTTTRAGGVGAGASPPTWSEWREEVHRRARRLSTRIEEMLKIRKESMGALPTPAEAGNSWAGSGVLAAGARDGDVAMPGDPAAVATQRALRAVDGLVALRGAIVPRLVRQLHQTKFDTGKFTNEPSWLHESFGVTDLLTDERYKLYECFDKTGLTEMLRRFRASALEMLAT